MVVICFTPESRCGAVIIAFPLRLKRKRTEEFNIFGVPRFIESIYFSRVVKNAATHYVFST